MGHTDTARHGGRGVTGPFARVPEVRRRAVQFSATALAIGLLIAIGVLGTPLRGGPAPFGLVSLQLAAAPDVADAMLDAWSGVPRARVLWTHGLDLALPFAYALAIGTAATRAADRAVSAAPSAQVAAGAVLVAAVADQVENLAIAVSLLASPSWASVLLTLAAATVKSATLALAVIALGVALARARRVATAHQDVGRDVGRDVGA